MQIIIIIIKVINEYFLVLFPCRVILSKAKYSKMQTHSKNHPLSAPGIIVKQKNTNI